MAKVTRGVGAPIARHERSNPSAVVVKMVLGVPQGGSGNMVMTGAAGWEGGEHKRGREGGREMEKEGEGEEKVNYHQLPEISDSGE